MAHTHGDGDGHQPHGGAGGLTWQLLDSVMLACAVVIGWLLAEQAWRWWTSRPVNYTLTPDGLSATEKHDEPGPAPSGPDSAAEG